MRETKIIETKGGHKIEVLTYITGREKRSIDEVYGSLELNGGKGVSGIKYEMLGKLEDREIDTIVKSVDGQTENVRDLVLDLPYTDMEVLRDHISEVTGKKKAIAQSTQSKAIRGVEG